MSDHDREYYETRLREQLDELEAEAEALDFKIDSSGWEPESDYHRMLDEIRIALEATREKWEELASSSDAAWPEIRDEFEEGLASLGKRIKDTQSVFQKILPE